MHYRKNAHIAAKFQWVTEHICALQNDIVVDLMLAQECQKLLRHDSNRHIRDVLVQDHTAFFNVCFGQFRQGLLHGRLVHLWGDFHPGRVEATRALANRTLKPRRLEIYALLELR